MVQIYTDGSCEPNPGPGGWAAVIVTESGAEKVLTGSESRTTNNRMEIMAALAAVEWCRNNEVADAVVHSDSQYVVNTFSQWVWGWERKGWKKDIKNRDLIQRCHELQKGMNLKWKWVKGHAGHEFNERCDVLAGQARLRGVPSNLRDLFDLNAAA